VPPSWGVFAGFTSSFFFFMQWWFTYSLPSLHPFSPSGALSIAFPLAQLRTYAPQTHFSCIDISSISLGQMLFRPTAINWMAFRPTTMNWMLFRPTSVAYIAHWFCGHKYRHRFMRDKRFHPSHQAAADARNRFSKRRHFKTNRWNYTQAYKDMP
jgi:hypothetical protein